MTREHPTRGRHLTPHRSVPHSPEGIPQVPEHDPLRSAGPKLERVCLGPRPLAPDQQHETQAGAGSLLPRRAHLQRGKNGGPAGGGGMVPPPRECSLALPPPAGTHGGGPETRVRRRVRISRTRGPSGVPCGGTPRLTLSPVPHRGHPHHTPGTPFLTPLHFSEEGWRNGGSQCAQELVRGAQTRGHSSCLKAPTHVGRPFCLPITGGLRGPSWPGRRGRDGSQGGHTLSATCTDDSPWTLRMNLAGY